LAQSETPMSTQTHVAIVGAGIVGLAVALEITKRFPHVSLVVLEKGPEVAGHQTSHNSGVIHSGIYYKPGSLKARLCTEGAEALMRFCDENGVRYEQCGKVIVATREEELGRLDELLRRGQGNGVKELRLLTAEEIREIEPHAAGIRGIHVPTTAIVDFHEVARQYAKLIEDGGGRVLLSHEVIAIQRGNGSTVIETTQGAIAAQLVINCAGLHSDRVRRLAGPKGDLDLTIVPFRGEYYEIAPTRRHLVKGLIYPVPDPQFPFLGVHLTKRVGGQVEAGPNAVLALKREGYSKKSFAARDVMEYALFPGFWKMAAKHWRMSVGEYHRSWSKAAFVRALQQLIPELRSEDLVAEGAGVRAQALDRQGKLLDDFQITFAPGIVHVCNVPSPAATASLAIGKFIVDSIARETGNPLQ
jgi:(S)-2-hydroxyglutarate dehydrogenase